MGHINMKNILYCILFNLLIPILAIAQTASNPHAVVGGGYSQYRVAALVGTVQTVKGTHATLGGWQILNPAATVCYLQLFNVASATAVTLGTTVPIKSIGLSAGAASTVPAVVPGIDFPLGIKIAATTTSTGSTACTVGWDVNLDYK